MKKLSLIGIVVMTSAMAVRLLAINSPTAEEILAGADRVRNPGKPFRVTLALNEYINGKARDRIGLVVYAKLDQQTGQFNDLVRYAEPRRDAGKMVLLKGTSLWFYDPASKASIRISPQQRLVGQASEGDVLSVNLARDYSVKLAGEETLLDADHKDHDCYHLDMAAATPDAIYNRIEYWVEKGTYHPIKGKFYSDSGRLLKIAYYHKYEEQLDALRPTEVVLIDSVNSNLATTIGYSDYRYQDIPDSWFQRDYLPRLKPE
ncbi:MAG TPA: outer membrane lipoprotein-sorting protein [Candidatus Sulfotelmatobacter sp.]|nr:outer membrane lipoprotein-sorting protein [Candidatus Sulfotelmatobacter sp.]